MLNVLCRQVSFASQVSSRTRALKAVANAIRVDASLLREDLVRAAIEARLSDEAVSVRDAVLELLSKCTGRLPRQGEKVTNFCLLRFRGVIARGV